MDKSGIPKSADMRVGFAMELVASADEFSLYQMTHLLTAHSALQRSTGSWRKFWRHCAGSDCYLIPPHTTLDSATFPGHTVPPID